MCRIPRDAGAHLRFIGTKLPADVRNQRRLGMGVHLHSSFFNSFLSAAKSPVNVHPSGVLGAVKHVRILAAGESVLDLQEYRGALIG